jgi:hypothetical protein
LASIIQGVEGVSLSDIVLLDDHDAKHYLKQVTHDDVFGTSPEDYQKFLDKKYRIDETDELSDTEFGSKFIEISKVKVVLFVIILDICQRQRKKEKAIQES